MSNYGKQKWNLIKETGQGAVTFVILLVADITYCATASFDVQDVCPHVTMTSCPTITRENGDTVQYIPKLLTPDLDWITQEISKDHQISEDARHYFCTEPGRPTHIGIWPFNY
ncbi:uncharacterized protein LOC121430475 [Lytechinus variegatus]|uniref:uncharacterized protein LOC121430475 n=1 Tax=Lytechinus variegatus TaxID=7654 RepID=UPI001BB24AB5|nr:uncharacterized protein LOC121430475 [Lytechinus variegatus]